MKLYTFLRTVLAILLVAGTFYLTVMGGRPLNSAEKKTYKPSEVQSLRLQVKQKDAQLAQQTFQIAQQRFTQTINEFNAEAKAIEKENSWPDTLTINPDTLEFTAPPESPEPHSPVAPVGEPPAPKVVPAPAKTK